MNGKTLEKTMAKMAAKWAWALKSIKRATRVLRWFDDFMRENHPTQTLALAITGKTA